MKNILNDLIKKNEALDKHEKISYFSVALILLGLISGIVYITAIISEPFADFFNRYIASAIRAILAFFTNILPFSLAEMLLLALPLAVIFLIIYAVKYKAKSWLSVLSYFVSVAAAMSLLFTSFVWSFGTGYHTSTIDKKLKLERADVTVDELKSTALILTEKINELTSELEFESKSFSKQPYSIAELNNKLNLAYERFQAKNNFIQPLKSNVKPVLLSEAMSYTHITGVYTYFTGEANININFPDYTIPYTAAHELAHQRGIAREDEANFIAFLVCLESDDAYIRYSGYLNTLEYVLSALNKVDSKAYKDVVSGLDDKVKYELNAYYNFYKKYQNSTAGKVSGVVNDTYLKVQGTEGTKSYGMVVDLTVSYYKSLSE